MQGQDITIEEISIDQKSVLRQLMEFCNYDFSPYDQADVNDYGFFGYEWIDHYWTDKGRMPYFIKVDGKYAGFVLVGHYTPKHATSPIWTINEFFVMKKYRRHGIGTYVARTLFERYRGAWKVSQIYSNDVSRFFWERVISEYTGRDYEKKQRFEDGFDRQFITFDNS